MYHLRIIYLPVLSVQIVVAQPIVSQALNVLTILLSFIIFLLENASDNVTANGRPSGTATARTVIDQRFEEIAHLTLLCKSQLP